MSEFVTLTTVDIPVVVGGILLAVSLGGYLLEWQDLGSTAGIFAFVLLALYNGVIVTEQLQRTAVGLFIALVGIVAIVFCVNAVRLLASDWERSGQLVLVSVIILGISLPFQVLRAGEVYLLERLAVAAEISLQTVGYRPTLQPAGQGQMTKLVFQNSGFYRVIPTCSGIGAVALFSGLVCGARTSRRKKLLGFGLVVTVVYALNLVRITFVGAAIAGNWFGFLGDGTIMTSYYVAEILVGQTFVVVASVVSFFILSYWIPDIRAFVTDLVGTLPRQPF